MTLDLASVLKKLLILFLLIIGTFYAKAFLMPLVISGILATLFLPFCHWMEKIRLPRAMAVVGCLVVLLLVISGIVFLLGWKISELTNDFSLLKEKSIEIFSQTQQYIFSHLGISLEKQMEILKSEQPTYHNMVHLVADSLMYVFTNIILILVYFIFLLYYRSHIKNFLLKLTKPVKRDEMEQIILSATNVSHQYLLGLSKMIFCLWIMYGIGFSFLGVKNALFFAILCGLLEIVPFVGNITGTILTVLVTALHGGDFAILIGIVITYAFVQFIQGWVLEPLILGPQVKINPLFTILALVLGELLWGIPGIILAIPITAIFKIICDHIDTLKPYGFLIGEVGTRDRDARFIKIFKSKMD